MAGELKGWNPDPFGVHEWRFFSDDGKPTLLVRDGSVRSYDRPPVSGDVRFARAFEPEPERECAPPPDVVLSVLEKPAGLNGSSGSQNGSSGFHSMATPVVPGQAGYDPLPMSRAVKVSYIVVLAAMAASGVALAVVHLAGHQTPNRPVATATSTTAPTTSSSTDGSTTTLALPSALKPSAAIAAADLISSWAAGSQSEAQSVATTTAVATLFAGHYTSGLAIDRGCSVQISPTIPVVCTYGPPGGANPSDPIYQLNVSQAPGGWYVSSVKIDN